MFRTQMLKRKEKALQASASETGWEVVLRTTPCLIQGLIDGIFRAFRMVTPLGGSEQSLYGEVEMKVN